jgi:high-affinity iron transporter
MLAAVTLQLDRRFICLPYGLLAGGIFALVYAMNIGRISEWLNYAGQEILNASLQLMLSAAIVLFAWMVSHDRAATAYTGASQTATPVGFSLLCALIITLAITREASELFVYLGGFISQGENLRAVLTGGGVGFGIGISAAVLVFYGLAALSGAWRFWVSLALLALFSGNMLAQAALQLMQADWLQSGAPLWDSSGWLPEESITGQMLYALVGYESRPSGTQAAAYLAGMATVLIAALAGSKVK